MEKFKVHIEDINEDEISAKELISKLQRIMMDVPEEVRDTVTVELAGGCTYFCDDLDEVFGILKVSRLSTDSETKARNDELIARGTASWTDSRARLDAEIKRLA